jgi:hypothetical protein
MDRPSSRPVNKRGGAHVPPAFDARARTLVDSSGCANKLEML